MCSSHCPGPRKALRGRISRSTALRSNPQQDPCGAGVQSTVKLVGGAGRGTLELLGGHPVEPLNFEHAAGRAGPPRPGIWALTETRPGSEPRPWGPARGRLPGGREPATVPVAVGAPAQSPPWHVGLWAPAQLAPGFPLWLLPGQGDPATQAFLTEPRGCGQSSTHSRVPLPRSEVLSPDPKAARVRVRVSTVGRSLGQPCSLGPGAAPSVWGWGSLQFAVSVSELGVEPRRRPLDGSSVVVKPAAGLAAPGGRPLVRGPRPRGSFSEKQSQLLS